MASTEKTLIARILEQFVRTGRAEDEQVKIILLPQGKTSFVEYLGTDGRSVLLDKYQIEGKFIWAGYSTRSETVYLSLDN